jgi:site-specific DNA-methyltransferase (adenine-specific)
MIGLTYSTEHYDKFNKTGDKKIFEDIIDKMILEEVSGMNESFRRTISNLPKRDKRLAILSILDSDRNLFKSIKSLITENKLSKVEHLKDVIYKIREYVKVGEVEQKKYGEVMSDLDKVVKPMINELPDDYWTNPDLKILDNCNGTGPFPLLVIWKLMNGLKGIIKDEEERYKHIVENMIYVAELQPKNQFIWMCIVDPYDEYDLNVYTGSFLDSGFDKHMKEVWNVDRFSLILGNPPYQKSDGGGGKGSSAIPIYNLFVEKSLKICDKLLYITPSRWFIGGKGLDTFRKMMIDNDSLKLIKHFPGNGSDLFGDSVEIKGGVSYFLIDNFYSGDVYINNSKINRELLKNLGIILENSKHYKILNKIINKTESFSKLVKSRNFFGKLIDGKKTLQNGFECIDNFKEDHLKCYVSKKEGFLKYIDRSLINNDGVNSFKVLTTKGTNIGKQGNTFLAKPNEICSETYLVIICENENESINILNYFKTNLFRYIFKLINNTQNSSKSTYRFVPCMNFDIEWSDKMIYEYFKLDDNDIKFIENNI